MVWLLVMCDSCLILTSRKKNYLFLFQKQVSTILLSSEKCQWWSVQRVGARCGVCGQKQWTWGILRGALKEKKQSQARENFEKKKRLNLHT